MRMLVPPVKVRKSLTRRLEAFYESGDEDEFNKIVREICNFYKIKKPKIVWRREIDHGWMVGLTYEDGRIHLIRPKYWLGSRKCWISTFYHEIGHFVLWCDGEEKADEFSRLMWRK